MGIKEKTDKIKINFDQPNQSAGSKREKVDFSGLYKENKVNADFGYCSGDDCVVKVVDLVKNFVLGTTTVSVLKKVNMNIKRGDFALLRGPSGCGKSTLLHAIYGLEPPTAGEVVIENQSIWKHTKNWRAFYRNQYIGFIPQQAFWLKSLSVLENVAVPGFIGGQGYRESLERAYKILQIVGMEDWANYRPFDLSGGQQQKVALARALLLNPKFLIADEPTGNLDQKAGTQLMELITSFNKEYGITVLMVTHDPDQEVYANLIIKMIDGEVVEVGKK